MIIIDMENITDTAFHGGKEKHQEYYNNLMVESVSDGRITERDKKQIQAFLSEIKACGKLSSQRTYKLAYQLIGMRRYIPEFSSATTSDVFTGLENLKAEERYTDSTKKDFITILKRFLLWLEESGEASPGLKIEKIRKIKAGSISVTKTADDILTPGQIDSMFRAVTNTRNRAMLELLYESGGRAGEIATLTWGQITFYSNYASVRLDSKTRKVRVVPLYTSHVSLRRWRDQCGIEPKPDDLVFPARDEENEPMSYNGMLKLTRLAARKAGLEKNVTLHIFRHSRITHLLQAGMNESTIKLLAWGDVGSTMLRVYAHLGPGDVENEFNKLYNIKPVDEFRGMDPSLSPLQCPTCGMLNPPGNRFCGGCGVALTPEARDELQDIKKEIHGSDDYKQLYDELMERMTTLEKKISI